MELPFIFPSVLFMTALFVRNLQPLQYEPPHTAARIGTWYSGRLHIGLWGLLIAMPLTVLVTGCVTLLHSWNAESALRQAATLTAGGVLAIVALHMLTD